MRLIALHPHRPGELNHELIAGSIGLGLLAAAWAHPFWRDYYPLTCQFKNWLGIPCLTCGGTRAMAAWTHLHWGEAWTMNPMVTLGAAALSLYLIYAAYALVTRAPRRLRVRGLMPGDPARLRWGVRGALVLAIAANWTYLILVGR